jgi:D-arabinose 1-dehydrogenase-like Zn-dependent alcohol dehydrogenase
MTGVGAQVALVGRWLGLHVVGIASTGRERRVAAALGIDVATPDDLPPTAFVVADTGGDVSHHLVLSVVERGGAVASFHPRPASFYSVTGDLGISLCGRVPPTPEEIREALALVARGAIRPAVGAVVTGDAVASWLNGKDPVLGPGRTVVTLATDSTA